MNVIRHERTDDWKIEIDGKVYWVQCRTVDGKEANWTVEVVRISPNGQNPYVRDVNPGGIVHRRIVAAVKVFIAEGEAAEYEASPEYFNRYIAGDR